MNNTSDTTTSRALTDAEAASIAAAQAAYLAGEIQQREVAPGSGIYRLVQS